ncbi:hypothetical protein RRG08_048012 [Elysia crispata]|uniref:Uncharacterized protein n=1 Tax=Elysia crispata TaxID=231223 RepID=A0AAE0XS37_9GAST|nr:hypothetical protein RRG08_048012 [Elysia crispata]
MRNRTFDVRPEAARVTTEIVVADINGHVYGRRAPSLTACSEPVAAQLAPIVFKPVALGLPRLSVLTPTCPAIIKQYYRLLGPGESPMPSRQAINYTTVRDLTTGQSDTLWKPATRRLGGIRWGQNVDKRKFEPNRIPRAVGGRIPKVLPPFCQWQKEIEASKNT